MVLPPAGVSGQWLGDGRSWISPADRSACVLSSIGTREAERFGSPPRRASSVTRAGKEENSGGLKYKAGRVSDTVRLGDLTGERPCCPGLSVSSLQFLDWPVKADPGARSQGHLGDKCPVPPSWNCMRLWPVTQVPTGLDFVPWSTELTCCVRVTGTTAHPGDHTSPPS